MSDITLFAIYLVFIFLGPVFSILAINTLFSLNIDLTFGTWFSMAWIHMVLAGVGGSK